MRKDSIIWFSISATIGIQIMKGIITKDQVQILDLFNKKYYKYSIAELGNKFGGDIGLRELQNLIIGNPIFDTLVYQKDIQGKRWISENPPISNLMYASDFHLPDSSLVIQKGSTKQLKTKYFGSLSTGSFSVAKIFQIITLSASNTIRLDLEFKTASDAVIPSYPFSVPDGYEHVKNQ